MFLVICRCSFNEIGNVFDLKLSEISETGELPCVGLCSSAEYMWIMMIT